MKPLSLLLVSIPAIIGGGLPLYDWIEGRRNGDIPSKAEWTALGNTYTPWHSELTAWFFGQLFTAIFVVAAALIVKLAFKESFRHAALIGGAIWIVIVILGLTQYGWAIAD